MVQVAVVMLAELMRQLMQGEKILEQAKQVVPLRMDPSLQLRATVFDEHVTKYWLALTQVAHWLVLVST
jgi:hypothetical protein